LSRFCSAGEKLPDRVKIASGKRRVPVPDRARGMSGFEYPLAQITPFNQITELAQRGLVGRCLAAEIDANKITPRNRTIKRLLCRRVRMAEPALKEIHPQHPLQTNRAPARPVRHRRRILMQLNNLYQARPGLPALSIS
jgi:hypothetical protein